MLCPFAKHKFDNFSISSSIFDFGVFMVYVVCVIFIRSC